MGFRPLHDWVVIKRNEAAETTVSGIIIPDSAKEKSASGTVVAVGPGRFHEDKKKKKEKVFVPTVLKPGQDVMFIDYMAKDVPLDGSEITLIREDDVLGIVENAGPLSVRQPYPVERKEERPPMVQTAATAPAPAPRKKAAKGKADVRANAKKVAPKGKEGKMKKTVKKAAPKKTAKKAAPKKKVAAKKAAPKKKVAAKKTAAKKAAPKKKAVAKKAAPKKKAAAKKTAKKK